MPGFPLLYLNPILFEKVINKIESKGYFRLQQTCRTMGESIRDCRNISIPLDDGGRLKFDCQMPSLQFITLRDGRVDVESLYGIRIRRIYICETGFEGLCAALKRNRITCAFMCLDDEIWSKEQCSTLLKILKPAHVEMNSDNSNRYEALFQSKSVKNVDVYANPPDLLPTMIQFLSTIPNVWLTVQSDQSSRPSHIRAILTLLCSHQFPNLEEVNLILGGRETTPSVDAFQGIIREFNVTNQSTTGEIWGEVQLPPQLSREFVCHIFADYSQGTGLWYRRKSQS